MRGKLTLEQLAQGVAEGAVDTVIVAFVDMQGRLIGKRMQAEFFLDGGHKGTHGCAYLLATDLEMATVPGLTTGRATEFGDFAITPDLPTLRLVPWLAGTALVLGDVLDPATGAEVPHSPRAMLKGQIARLHAMGLRARMASELEFHLYCQSYDAAMAAGYRGLDLSGGYNADYHIFQTSKEEEVIRAIRTGLNAAGIPVEGSRGEGGAGQGEINLRHAGALEAADCHALAKNGAKEIAFGKGRALTFLAKVSDQAAGSSSHVHQSLWTLEGEPAFLAPDGMPAMMRHFLAGQLAHAAATTLFLAPYVNSYKRLSPGSFAPTRAVWSMDNRTAAYRVVGVGSKAARVECRIGGADLTPHLAYAALLAAGIDGIERGLDLEPEFKGDAYEADAEEVPRTLRAAIGETRGSAMLRTAFGEAVVEHYCIAADWEQSESDRCVTDWDIARGFERA